MLTPRLGTHKNNFHKLSDVIQTSQNLRGLPCPIITSGLQKLSSCICSRFCPNRPRGVPRVDDRRVISAMVHVIRNGLMWRDAPATYGPHKTLYNRFVRYSRAGVFDRLFAALAAEGTAMETVMIDATHLKAHRTSASLRKEGLFPAASGGPKGGLTSKLHTVCDGDGKPLILLPTEGHTLGDARIACRAAGQRLSRRRERLAGAAGRQGPDRRQVRRGATGSATPCPNWTSRPAFQGARTARRQSPTTPKPTSSAIWSSACSAGLRTGAASQPDMTDAHTRS